MDMRKMRLKVQSKKQTFAVSKSSVDIPGIYSDGKGYVLTTHNLPASEHFFVADHFQICRKHDMLDILFGSVSSFSSNNEYTLAIEISIPISYAVDFLYTPIWELPAMNSDKPIINSIQETVKKMSSILDGEHISPDEKLSLPKDPNSFRKFPANFVSCALSNGQAMLEFFEANPEMLAHLGQASYNHSRQNAGVKNVVCVILSPAILLKFCEKTKDILEKYKSLSRMEAPNV